MESTLVLIIFTVLLLLGVPIGIALGVSGLALLSLLNFGIQGFGRNFAAGIAKFPLLAIPFFILAGVILEKAKLAGKISRLFELIAGRTTGGLAIVAIITCMFWGAISGSGPATTAAVGLVLIGPMVRYGYDRNFSAAAIANASGLSIVIPPSIAFIIYGNLTDTSVGDLFKAGIIPGILMGCGIIVVAWLISKKRMYSGVTEHGSFRDIIRALKDASWALLSPIIILGGIYSGIFTPTEAAVVAVFYSLFVALVIYRTINLKDLLPVLVDASVMSSVIMFIVVFAGIFSWAVSMTGFVDKITRMIISISSSTLVILLLLNAFVLVLGMFLDAISITYLLMPILIPVLKSYGIDPVWFGVIFITALAIGQSTPPVGVNLFTAANLTGSSVDAVSREIGPFILVNIIILIILSLVPWLSLCLVS